jgi:hypothetical protein
MTNTQRLLELALKGLEAERAKVDDEIKEIKSQLNGSSPPIKANGGSSTVSSRLRKRRTMSAEARKRISEGMKRRYAALRKAVRKK